MSGKQISLCALGVPVDKLIRSAMTGRKLGPIAEGHQQAMHDRRAAVAILVALGWKCASTQLWRSNGCQFFVSIQGDAPWHKGDEQQSAETSPPPFFGDHGPPWMTASDDESHRVLLVLNPMSQCAFQIR